jgi:ribose-phosphate pyrophosphokinase
MQAFAEEEGMAAVGGLMLFALDTTRDYGARVADRLEVPLSPHEEREFEDGEHKARPLVDVRGRDVFVIHSLHGDGHRSANDKLCRLLFFIGALKDAGAGHVTALAPYLCYARKDRRTKSRDPVTTKYVARLFEACGADAVMTFDVHNLAAFENAFRCPTYNIEAAPLFVEHFAKLLRGERIAVVSPDVGGAKRAEAFRRALSARVREVPSFAFVEKERSGGVVSGDLLVGDVADRTVIILDDLISSGTTLRRAAARCREAGARRIFAAATHGLFAETAPEILGDPVFEAVVVTDTARSRAAEENRLPANIVTLETAGLADAAITAAHCGR